MYRTSLLTTIAVFIAIGTIGAQLLWFPAGVAKAYPVQHTVNVMAAIMLGPIPAIVIAFVTGLVRVMLGLGTLVAFPGGMIGAFLAGLLYKQFGRRIMAVIGEIIGTGVIGSLFAVPYTNLLMGSSLGALVFFPSFLVSSISGAFIGYLVMYRLKKAKGLQHVFWTNSKKDFMQ